MSEIDLHLQAVQAVAREREARIAQLEHVLQAARAEHEQTVEQWEGRYERLRARRREKLTPDNLKARHRNLKRDLFELRADAELAGDHTLLHKIAGMDRPAFPFIREQELNEREWAVAEREAALESRPRWWQLSKWKRPT